MSTADRIEREAKFQLLPEHEPAKFVAILAQDGYAIRSLGTIDLTDTYLDSPSYALLRHGLALRVRHGVAAAYEVGIKSLEGTRKGASLSRLDIAFPFPADADPLDVTTWPAALFDELARVVAVKPKALQPLVVVRQKRAKSHIHPVTSVDDAPWVVEWSEDEVWIDGTDASGCAHFHELEVELLPARGSVTVQNGNLNPAHVDAERAAFDSLVTHMQAQFGLVPIFASKFVRGLERCMAQTHGRAQRIAPAMSLAEAGRLLLHQQLLQILLNEHGARTGKKARYVHDMRVAVRRARAVLRLCAGSLPKREVKHFRKRLKRLNRVLGTVRDLDVTRANLRAFARNQPDRGRHGFKKLRAAIQARRHHARTELIEFLDSKKYRKFITSLDDFCAAPVEMPSEENHMLTRHQIRHTVPSLIWAAFEAVRAYELAFEADAVPLLETFHALRIETKYLRYLIEFTQHLLGREGESLAQQLRLLQEHLGTLNDAHVEDQHLSAWQAQIEDEDGLHTLIADRRRELAARIAELRQNVPLASFIAPRNRRKLAVALAMI